MTDLSVNNLDISSNLMIGNTNIKYDISSFNIINKLNGVSLMENATTWTSLSDIKLKENIVPITDSLDKILQINGYYYNMINNPNKLCVGVIAQEVNKVLPEAINKIDNDYLGVNYTDLIPLLINGIQDLKKQVDLLTEQNIILFNLINKK